CHCAPTVGMMRPPVVDTSTGGRANDTTARGSPFRGRGGSASDYPVGYTAVSPGSQLSGLSPFRIAGGGDRRSPVTPSFRLNGAGAHVTPKHAAAATTPRTGSGSARATSAASMQLVVGVAVILF